MPRMGRRRVTVEMLAEEGAGARRGAGKSFLLVFES